MYHSLYINDKNTWDDYALIPQNKIYFPIANQKTKMVEIEGASGSLDFSNYLTGYPIYGNRTGSITFYLLDAVDARTQSNSGYPYPANYTFYDIFDKIRADLDGKQAKLWLEDDPDYYYEGRINVTTAMGSPRPTVTISYNISPYKIAKNPVAWDLNGLGSLVARQIIPAELAIMPVSFKFTLTGTTSTIKFTCPMTGVEEARSFAPGTYDIYEWVIAGETEILLTASVGTTLHIEYNPGRL